MRQSMTGFAGDRGGLNGLRWVWDLRSVNGKGLDLRIRVPDWIEGLEAGLRAALSGAVSRGTITLSLRLHGTGEEAAAQLNEAHLATVLAAMGRIEERAMQAGLSLAPSTAADIVALRGILESGAAEQDSAPLCAQMLREFEALLGQFIAMRAQEGEALQAVLLTQLDAVEDLIAQAAQEAEARREEHGTRLRTALARVLDNAEGADPQRVAQELALIAVKSDVTEEIDRLRAHVGAARELLGMPRPVGRKLDFLMQEFNREANTLCSKAQSAGLTRVGLDLKTVIDQMREQVQNVE